MTLHVVSHHSALAARGVVIHLNLGDLQGAVLSRRPHTPALVPVAPVVPDPLARLIGNVVSKRLDLLAIYVEVDLARKPVSTVFVRLGRGVRRDGRLVGFRPDAAGSVISEL